MKASYLSHIAIGAAVLFGSWTLFGQDRSRVNPAATSGERFQVIASNGSVIMIETQTGQTWTYIDSTAVTTLPVWIPIQRLDSRDEVEKWKTGLRTKNGNRPENTVPHRYDENPNAPSFRQAPPLFDAPESRFVPDPGDIPSDDFDQPRQVHPGQLPIAPQPSNRTVPSPVYRDPSKPTKKPTSVPLPDSDRP